MANKARIGLDHFPLGTDFFDDKKVQRLIIYYGGNGIMVYTNILCYIYSRGYYAVIDNDLKSSIIRHTGLLEGDIMDLIGYMVREGFFDSGIYNEHSVLTSKDIQKRYLLALKMSRRKGFQTINVQYWVNNVQNTPIIVQESEKNDKSIIVQQSPLLYNNTPLLYSNTPLLYSNGHYCTIMSNKEKEKKVIKEKDKEKEKEKEKESTKEKEKEKEKEITKENYQKKEKETPPLKNQKIHDSKQSTLLNNGTMAIHSTGQESLHTTHDPNSPNSFPLNPLSPSRAKLPVDTTNDVPPAKIAVSVDNQQDKETEGESDIDNQEVTFDLDNNSIGKYGFKAYSGTKNGFDPQSGVSISKGKNVAQMAAKKSNGGIFGAVQFRQCLVDNGVDGQVADDYMAVRRAKKGVFTKTAFTLLLNEVQRHNISLNDAALTCIDRNWIAYNHEWVLKLEFQYVNGVKLEKKFNPSPPPISSKPKMIKNENGTFTIRKG
jgi:hypothetical protein